MRNRRIAAVVALVLAIASGVIAAVVAVVNFPRGLWVLVLVLVAMATAWHGLLGRGLRRVIGLTLAVACLAAALILLLSRDALGTIAAVATAILGLAAARAAFATTVPLDPAEAPKHPVLIFNPRSGGGKADRFRLAEEATRRGIEPIELSGEASLEELVSDALERGADALAMAGGDGSQAVVAAAASRAGVPFACIPAGTRNHFALDLGVDRDDVVGALDAFVHGGERLVDLATVNDRVFVNNVSLGFYADAVQHQGYRDAKIRTLLETLPDEAGAAVTPLRWRDPDGRAHSGGLVMLVSNNPYRLGRALGSGTRPTLSSGHLGVAVVDAGPELRRSALRTWTLTSLEVDADNPVPAGIDGEAVVLEPPLRFGVLEGALRVRISLAHHGSSPAAGLPDNGWDGVRALTRIALGTE